jgi:ankyrin repeat protein
MKLLFYLVSNNLAKQVDRDTIQRFCHEADVKALDFMLPKDSSSADAFCEKILPYVLESENKSLLQAILRRYSHPDQIILQWNGMLVTPLIIACSLQNLAQAKYLLGRGADATNFIKSEDISPLYCVFSPPSQRNYDQIGAAASSNFVNEELVQILVEAGAEVNVSRERGYTPLQLAVIRGNLNLTRLLLSKGANVNACSSLNENALHLLVTYSHRFDEFTVLEIAKELIGAGADIESTFKRKYGDIFWTSPPIHTTAIDEAIRIGHFPLFQFLLFWGAKLSSKTVTYAIESRNSDLINYLLEAWEDSSSSSLPTNTETDLIPIIQSGNMALFQMMCRLGIVPKTAHDIMRAIDAAASIGQREMVEKLVEVANGPEIVWDDFHYPEVVRTAVVAGHPDLARYLIRSGFPCNYIAVNAAINKGDADLTAEILKACPQTFDFFRCLLSVIECGEHSLLERLLARGYDPNSWETLERDEESYGDTALGEAVRLNETELVQILLNAGADPNFLPSRDSRSPLARSVMSGNTKMTELLLDVGANPDDSMAIYEAVKTRNVQGVKILLNAYRQRYAKCRSGYGCEALKMAIENLNLDLVRTLLSFGVDPTAPADGESQLDVAIINGDREHMTIIREVLTATFQQNGRLGVSARDRLRVSISNHGYKGKTFTCNEVTY